MFRLLIAAMAMIIQQMEAQLANPGMEIAISTSFGPPKLAAKFKTREWVGHDLTHPPTDDRVNDLIGYGYSRAPMHQNRTLYLFPRNTRHLNLNAASTINVSHSPLQKLRSQR